ncbi:hypothetical protein CCR82_17525 [Halochromatium salexigens]|uniref:Protein PsiE n=1 Tax=Halochromatium salexigens TaxID=49447 RepID=A0AAJ0XHZ1_HALSE|nr:hypothetical protein [Halochromatium salexigens]
MSKCSTPSAADSEHGGGSRRLLRRASLGALELFEGIGLILITIAAMIAAGQEIWQMIQIREVSLADLLLLFIYLEVLTMVGIYLECGALPVRIPLYIAIVALARHLIIGMKTMSDAQLIATSAAVLILALAVLVVRYGHFRFHDQSDSKAQKDGEPD